MERLVTERAYDIIVFFLDPVIVVTHGHGWHLLVNGWVRRRRRRHVGLVTTAGTATVVAAVVIDRSDRRDR